MVREIHLRLCPGLHPRRLTTGGSLWDARSACLARKPAGRRHSIGAVPVIRVLIAARVRLYRDGLASLLAREEQIEIAATVTDGNQALARLRFKDVDVVIVDTALRSSLEAIGAIHAANPDVPVVALSVADDDPAVLACAEAGAAGFVTRDGSAQDLVAAICGAERGELTCTPRLTSTLFGRIAALAAERVPPPPIERLTSREREVVLLIEEGLSNKQIARRLQIQLPTVKNHVHHILNKLDLAGRGQVMTRVRENALPQPR
jgi:two-component system nitrate/nitrite response regulator NarL